ncbi:hypothetical protein SCG7086_AA_00650 [Chlamydiales bacterium SCGC AG-110-P3]|nr:hypothetical protein SCG7086_AA_00650 [Chlamydiales bacterium SCGC AG-110-P3]
MERPVALEAAKENRTINELASEYKIHPSQVSQWKKELLDSASSLFEKSGKAKKYDDMHEKEIAQLSISRQCELLDLNRSSYYINPGSETSFNLLLMRLIDQQFTKGPCYGRRRMTVWLNNQGYSVNSKRV